VRSGVASSLAVIALLASYPALAGVSSGQPVPAPNHQVKKVPKNAILVKGAWSSEDDRSVPVPEDATLTNDVFRDRYFGVTYSLPKEWVQKYSGPPPSDSGRYVLAEISRPDSYKGDARGNILITAQDLFFSPTPASNAVEMVNYARDHLQPDYKLEGQDAKTTADGHRFVTLSYWSPVAELHWYVIATEIRCHAVEFVFMNRDRKTLASTVQQAEMMKLPPNANPEGSAGGEGFPVCIKDYARGDNLLERVDPFFSELRFNPIPVRIIIGRTGRVKHIHFLSAFPDQASAISQALRQWKFKPYLQDGKPVEVETGIMFGRAPRRSLPTRRVAAPVARVQAASRLSDY
jgi:Gram-negative bacterial TonB protein C-terminal